jgi:hypothetical protein
MAWGESAGGHCIVPLHIPLRTSGVGARWGAGVVGVARAAPGDRRALRRRGTPAVPAGRGGMATGGRCQKSYSSYYTNSIYEQFYGRTYRTVSNKILNTMDSSEKEKGKQ